MKINDVVEIYGNPHTQVYPLGKARLIQLIEDCMSLELWEVEFVDQPGRHFNVLIKKQ